MQTEYQVVYQGGTAEITEKKSRFIAAVMPVKSEEEALSFVEVQKKKYWNASHNCYAYAIGANQELLRFSDDGEPGGTAGKPILDVILGMQVHNVAVVVTRYFGGTLLGTGGLVRAYSKAAREGLGASQIITRTLGIPLRITTDYTGLGKIQYLLGERKITILNAEYTDLVTLDILVSGNLAEEIRKEITEGTSGRARIEMGEKCWFANLDGEIILLDDKEIIFAS